MNVYELGGQDSTVLTVTGALQVRVAQEGPPGAVGLVAQRADGGPHPANRPADGVLILPTVEGRAVVRVLPPAGAPTFPAGVRVGLRLRSAAPGSDEVVVRTVDVTGLAHRDLVVLRADAGRGAVTVEALDAVTEAPVGPLQAAARAAARSVLGVDRVAEADAREIVAVVDPSASMAASLADGGVEAAVDVLVGLSLVVGRGRGPRICLGGRSPLWLPVGDAPGLGAAVAVQVAQRGFECGFRVDEAVLDGAVGPGRVEVHLVTDAVPAAPVPGWRVLAVGTDAPGPGATGQPPPGPGATATDHLLGHPHLLGAMLRSLLGPVPVAPHTAGAGAVR